MNLLCIADRCPALLSGKCVFYEGDSLVYIGVNNNDNYLTVLQKIDEAIGNIVVGATDWGEIGGNITDQIDLIAYLSSNYYPLIGNPSSFLNLSNLIAGTGISITGTYPNITISATATGSVQSVTGLNTDNTDPQNPIVKISVDGVTITGDGTPGNPLAAGIVPAFIESVSNTSTINLTVTGTDLTADFASLLISQFTNDSGYLTSAALTGYVPYTGATQDVDLGNNNISTKSLLITGVNGNGHIHLRHQSSDASSTGQSTVLFADSSGDLKYKNDGGYYTTLVTSANTANRIYTFQNASGTLAFLSDIPSLAGYVPTSRNITINGVTYDLSADRTWSVGTVTNVTATSPLFSSGGATPDITIQQSSSSQNGYLSSTDWTTFNGKGDVFGPGSSVNSNFASFNGATGKLIKDSGYSPSSFISSGSAWLLASGGTFTGNNEIVGTGYTYTMTYNGINASSPSDGTGLLLRNTTAAANGAQQWSPAWVAEGRAWGTVAGASQPVKYRIILQTVQNTVGTGLFKIQKWNGTDVAYSDALSYDMAVGTNGLTVTGFCNATTSITAGTSVTAAFASGFILSAGVLTMAGDAGTSRINYTASYRTRFVGPASSNLASTQDHFAFQGGFVSSSSTAVGRFLSLTPTYNLTGTSTSDVVGIDYDPVVTSVLGIHYAMKIRSGGVVIGHTTLGASTTRLQVRGIGTTTGNLALFQDNSGTERFKILDNGKVYLSTAPTNDNTETVLLLRNISDGEIKTRTVSSILASVSVGNNLFNYYNFI